MNKRLSSLILIFMIISWLPGVVLSQGKLYKGPIDPAGDKSFEREGWMTGNRVLLYFQNNTELSNCCGTRYSKWPNNDKGQPMTDGVALLIGARVLVKNDTIPAPWSTDPNVDTLYFIQTSYREQMDRDINGTVEWGIYPVPGYNNPGNEYVAMSNLPDSWPIDGWPAQGFEKKWPGEWNGRFGRGVAYADLETYFVANDAQDQEYLQPNLRVKYYPRPGVKIGDLNPDVTTNYGKPWGGLGLRIETRGMQWSNPQTQDAIFWEYNITNISDYDLPEVAFGYWNDNGIGGNEPTDDLAYFDTYLDLAFSWDVDMVGEGGIQPGVLGFAFLESPGMGYDNIDNDEDGIIDEKRDNVATVFYSDSLAGIADVEKFKRAYGEPRPHWDADEDGDWQDGIDENGNGIYDPNEFYGDDVGTDGVGPLDLNYTGPDANGTECNHKPDYIEGIGSEPNFATTDVSESDMIGLTSFQMFPIPGAQTTKNWFRDDEGLWNLLSSNKLEAYSGSIANLVELFGAATFPLYKGRTERVSMSMLHSTDFIPKGNISPTVPQLARKKEIVQVVYERDYRFATPPKMPTLKATAANGKVILTWNDIADKRTTEPLLRNANDFEGYKLYKATDKNFSDPELITNGFGEPTLKKPLFQCDIVDGRKGFTDFGLVDGIAYYLGDDTGIRRYFIDDNVENGVTYYYALVAYDYGIPNIGEGITPYENSIVLDLDEYGEVRNKGINVAIVTPTAKAAGYVAPEIEILSDNVDDNKIGNTEINIEVIDHKNVKAGNKYKVVFHSTVVDSSRSKNKKSPYDMKFVNDGYSIFDITDGNEILVFKESPDSLYNMRNSLVYGNPAHWPKEYYYYPVGKMQSSDLFDGVQFSFTPKSIDASFAEDKSGWITGEANINITPSVVESDYFPWDYEIIFTDNPNAYTSRINLIRNVITADGKRLISTDLLSDLSYNFYVINKSFKDDNDEYVKLEMMVYDVERNGTFDRDKDEILVGHLVEDGSKLRWGGTVFSIDFKNISSDNEMPNPGDVYRVTFNRPLSERDSILFKVNSAKEEVSSSINDNMEKIKVVPNPYIATNKMEPALLNPALNQQRRIMFTNIPAQCKIKIYTVSGVLVDEIDVDNPTDKGSVHWDLLTNEGLEIASGIYIYHVKSIKTGKEKIGKFAVLK